MPGGGQLNRLATRLSFLYVQKKAGLTRNYQCWRTFSVSVFIFAFAFLTTFLAASLFGAPKDTRADSNTSSTSSASGYNLSVSATSSVNLDLAVSDSDTMTVRLGNVSVSTTSPGYSLYLGMTGDSSNLTSTDISGIIAGTSGTFTSPAALTRGTWGYAIPNGTSHIASNGFNATYVEMGSSTPNPSALFAIPPTASSNPQLIATSSTATTGDTYPIYYAVRANSDTAPGNYSNNVMFTALADAGPSRALTLTPNSIDADASTTVSVVTTLYSTADYLTGQVYLGDTPLSCARTSLAPLSYSCTVPATSAGTYTISVSVPGYAMTYSAELTVSYPYPLMQEFTPTMCTQMSVGETMDLVDSRDNNIYTIAKFTDNNCWMTENLRLGDGTKAYTLTSADSNVYQDFELPIAQTSGNTSWGDATNSSNAKHVYATGNADYGNYYNWYTATAGTGLGTMKSASATNLTNASSSICPKGWRLPDGGQSTDKSFYQLDRALGGNGSNRTDATQRDKYLASPYNFLYSGIYSYGGSGANGQDFVGHWWSRSSSTTVGTTYDLFLSSDGNINPQNNSYPGHGFSIRCVAMSGTLSDISTMQEVTPAVVANTTIGTTKTLVDIRDGNTYTVRKHEDGNIWMTENLRLGDGTKSYTLTSSDSDVSADFELPIAQTSGYTVWSDADNTTNTKHIYATGDMSYGNFYNWYTATAGTGTGDMVSASMTDLDNASSSICPKGWRLPDGGQSPTKSFYALDLALGGNGSNRTDVAQKNKYISSPYSFVYGGYYHYSSGRMFYNNLGFWWTRSALLSPNQVFILRIEGNGYIGIQYGGGGIGSGYYIRCVNK